MPSPFPQLTTLTNEHQRSESQLTGLQCAFQRAWDYLLFNWLRRETLLPVIHHPEFLSVVLRGRRREQGGGV